MSDHYNISSKLWVQPFSVLLGALFPIEYVFGEWIFLKAKEYTQRMDKEDITSLSSSDILTGSNAEGFSIPRMYVTKPGIDSKCPNFSEQDYWTSDQDLMCLTKGTESNNITFVDVEPLLDNPRYVKLKLTEEWKCVHPSYRNMNYLPHSFVLWNQKNLNLSKAFTGVSMERHGPVTKLADMGKLFSGDAIFEKDLCYVLNYPTAWPEVAMEWLVRDRKYDWPSPSLVQEIFELGCHVAPVARESTNIFPSNMLEVIQNPEKQEEKAEWRLSFSVAENKLGQSVSPVQRYVFVVLKMLKKYYLPKIICTYHLKNLLFWECEEQPNSFWKEDNIAHCLITILSRLQECLKEIFLPHFVIPESNLLEHPESNEIDLAIQVIKNIKKDLMQNIVYLLQRINSHKYMSTRYHTGMELDHFLQSIRHETLETTSLTQLNVSLYKMTIKQSSSTITKIKDMSKQNPEMFNLLEIQICIYKSILARNLCKLYFLQNKSNHSKEMFSLFMRENIDHLLLTDDFIKLTFEFFQAMENDMSVSAIIENTSIMTKLKDLEIQSAREIKQSQRTNIDWIKNSDLEMISSNLCKLVSEKSLEQISLTSLEKILGEESFALYQKNNVSKTQESMELVLNSGIKKEGMKYEQKNIESITKHDLVEALKKMEIQNPLPTDKDV